jgi:hypothetical protein
MLSGMLDGIQRSATLLLLSIRCSCLSIDAHSNPAIFTVVLAINDKHTLSVKHLPTRTAVKEAQKGGNRLLGGSALLEGAGQQVQEV